jgi:hypothetical protein
MFMRFFYPEKRSEDVIRRGLCVSIVLAFRAPEWVGGARSPKANDGDNRRNAVVQQAALYHLDRRVQAN